MFSSQTLRKCQEAAVSLLTKRALLRYSLSITASCVTFILLNRRTVTWNLYVKWIVNSVANQRTAFVSEASRFILKPVRNTVQVFSFLNTNGKQMGVIRTYLYFKGISG